MSRQKSSTVNLLKPGHHDAGNANRIMLYCGERIRFNHDMRRWLHYSDGRWVIDHDGYVRGLARDAILEFYMQAKDSGKESDERFARQSLNASRIDSALSLVQSDLPIRVEDLDGNPDLLNFLNGTVDLKTGKLHQHDRMGFITKLIRYNFHPAATCPNFEKFLNRIMGAETNPERAQHLVEYLQRALGYSATGHTSEKVVHICWGAGDNGKTTLLITIRSLLGDYAASILIETLMVRQMGNNEHADLADLRGARFVQSSETEQGQRLNEARLKRITQGMGTIKAVRKYENPIEFPETHKLWIDANHLPTVRGQDNAIWNRLCLIPFEVVIPKAEQDLQLKDKLLAEAEGILAWIVRGAVQWCSQGLSRPPEISGAVADWRDSSDPLQDFLKEECQLKPDAHCLIAELWEAYEFWCMQEQTECLARPDFNARLESLGCIRDRQKIDGKQVRIWKGVCLAGDR
jgi:putative DNA primase/helicase